jgi:hypothetical protein
MTHMGRGKALVKAKARDLKSMEGDSRKAQKRAISPRRLRKAKEKAKAGMATAKVVIKLMFQGLEKVEVKAMARAIAVKAAKAARKAKGRVKVDMETAPTDLTTANQVLMTLTTALVGMFGRELQIHKFILQQRPNGTENVSAGQKNMINDGNLSYNNLLGLS